jgi:predicted RNA-binding Zn-ribbon protein involved in translation (DUF1610 family)
MAGKGSGRSKKQQKLVFACPKCGKQMRISLQGSKWQSTTLKSYWTCTCGQERIRVKGSGHEVV